jgi:hypothetical protein
MKFKVQRKLNLANIDKELWPYETEDIGIEDADSFEEAQQLVDKLVAERIGYYKAKSEEHARNKNSVPPKPDIAPPAPNTNQVDVPNVSNPTTKTNDPAVNTGMPAEFNV